MAEHGQNFMPYVSNQQKNKKFKLARSVIQSYNIDSKGVPSYMSL